MMKTNKELIKNTVKRYLGHVAVGGVWLLIWWGASELAAKASFGLLLPSPLSVAQAFSVLLQTKSFYLSCLKSMLRVLGAWGIGLTLGTVLAYVTAKFNLLRRFFSPAVHVIKATPVASFIILALVLMQSGTVPVFTGALMSLPIVWANISQGLNAPDKKLIEMADAFGMSKKNRLRYVKLPVLKPYFTAAATTAMGLTWKASIAAEVICIPKQSIGENLYNAKLYLETPALFAWTIAVILMSVALERCLLAVLKGSEKYD